MSKRILVTGIAGFVGSHFLEYLITHTDWEIVGLSRMSRAGNLNRLQSILEGYSLPKRVTIVWHDLNDPLDSIDRNIGRLDYIVHMAADSHVEDSINRRKAVFMNNTLSTVNLLEYAVKFQPELTKFIYYSTDEVYGDAYNQTSRLETDRLKPSNPYAAGKASGEMACNAWRMTTGLPVLITNTMNMYGERQDPEKMIPKTIGRFLKGLPALVHTSGGVVGSRFWLHAKNSASAVLFCLDNKLEYEKVNVAGEVELNNKQIAERIAEAMGVPFIFNEIEASKIRPGYDRRYSVDDSLIKGLGWKPEISFNKGIEAVVKWSKRHPEWVS